MVNNMVNAVDNTKGIVLGTAASAVIGAGITGTTEYISQKSIINRPQLFSDIFERSIEEAKRANKSKEKIELLEKSLASVKKFAKTKKIDWKHVRSAALNGAVVCGGAFLAWTGIKALFFK